MINELMDEAFRLFEEAEMKVEQKPEESINLLRRAVANLFNTYLLINGVEDTGSLVEMYRECETINPEFETIRTEVEYLNTVIPGEVDAEELLDQANEIWDFIEGVLTEEELENN